MNKPPVIVFKNTGVEVAIWDNGDEQKSKFSITIRKRYKRKDSDEWDSTDFLSSGDALIASHLLLEAWKFIFKKSHERTP